MIDFISADKGGIKMYDDGVFSAWANTAEDVAYCLTACGVAEEMFGSSSMDFASEEGFDTDDGAMLLMKRAFELI